MDSLPNIWFRKFAHSLCHKLNNIGLPDAKYKPCIPVVWQHLAPVFPQSWKLTFGKCWPPLRTRRRTHEGCGALRVAMWKKEDWQNTARHFSHTATLPLQLTSRLSWFCRSVSQEKVYHLPPVEIDILSRNTNKCLLGLWAVVSHLALLPS